MLVLDANILIRAVLGSRVHGLLRKYADQVEFLAPDTAFLEAREHLPKILETRKIPAAPALATLELLGKLVQTVEFETYGSLETLLVSASTSAMRTIGPCSLLPSRSAVRSGPKTTISSAAASQRGPRIGLSCTWRRLPSERL